MQPRRNRSQMEVAFQYLEAHMLFVCPECGEIFQSQQQWRQHLNFHHDYLCKKPEDFGFVEISDRYHECQTCNVMVADGKRAIALLQYHRFLHLPHSRTYRCRHCPASFTRKRVLCEHLCRSHELIVGDKVTQTAIKKLNENASETNMKSKTESVIDQPKKTELSSGKINTEFYMRYICPQCGKQIEDYKKWIVHIKMVHTDAVRTDCEMQRVSGTKNYYCKICRKVIFSSDSARLQRHYFSHMPHKVAFQCAFCKVRRTYKTELLHHFIRTHIKEFEMQRKHVKKPLEWGADVNELLDKELDLLLQYGSGVGSIKGPSSMQFTSTTVSNNYSQKTRQPTKSYLPSKQTKSKEQNFFHNLLGVESDTTSQVTRYKDKNLDESGTTSSLAEKRSWQKMNQESIQPLRKYTRRAHTSNQTSKKCELDALCAEIFGDIETESEMVSESAEKSEKCINEEDIEQGAVDMPLDNNQEEIVSIEINPVDESELSQLDETVSEDTTQPKKRQKLSESTDVGTSLPTKSKHYPTLKSLFNAKILHLCPKCGISFGEQSVWRDHVLTAHESLNKIIEQSYKPLEDQDSNLCLTCMQVLATTKKSELQRHCFTHMPYFAYLKCTLCGTCKSNKLKMLRHLQSQHGSLLEQTSEVDIKEEVPVTEHSSKDNEIKEEVEKTESPRSKKGEFHHLLRHLIDSRDRLNRIAAGIEAF